MDFNVLPHATLLRPQSTNKANQTTTQTVNVILPNNVKDTDEPSVSVSTATPNQVKVQPHPEQIKSRDVNLVDPPTELTEKDKISTINFLKLVLDSYMNNPIKYNGLILCSVPTLENLIETLSGCDDCQVDIGDFETNCCGTGHKNILPVTKIWVRNGESSDVFKYKYSNLLQVFEEYHISLKFVYVE